MSCCCVMTRFLLLVITVLLNVMAQMLQGRKGKRKNNKKAFLAVCTKKVKMAGGMVESRNKIKM